MGQTGAILSASPSTEPYFSSIWFTSKKFCRDMKEKAAMLKVDLLLIDTGIFPIVSPGDLG